MPATPDAFTPSAPKCPTPTGKTTAMATKKCTEQLTQTETYKACKRVLGKRFTITEAVTQCVADVCVSENYLKYHQMYLVSKITSFLRNGTFLILDNKMESFTFYLLQKFWTPEER